MKAEWFTDPADRYLRVVQATPAATTTDDVAPELSPAALEDVIETATSSGLKVESALAEHLAKHTRLRTPEAMPIVAQLAKRKTAPHALAAATSQAAASLSVSADVELSDPAMLGPLPRLLAAAALAAAVLMSVVYAHVLPAHSSGWAYAAFMFIVFVGGVGILVLVMGYRNVTIKGSGGK